MVENGECSKRVLVMFSGGRDSFLTACLLAEQGHEVSLVSFDNGLMVGRENAEHGALRLHLMYPDMKFLGVRKIAGIWREFLPSLYNAKFSKLVKDFGDLTLSQLNCMLCRSAMYIWAIAACTQSSIANIAVDSHEGDNFVCEMPIMRNCYDELLKSHGLTLLLPVRGIASNRWKRKNRLLCHGFVPKTLEPQCLIGVPADGVPDDTVQEGIRNVFITIVQPRVATLVDELQASDLMLVPASEL